MVFKIIRYIALWQQCWRIHSSISMCSRPVTSIPFCRCLEILDMMLKNPRVEKFLIFPGNAGSAKIFVTASGSELHAIISQKTGWENGSV